MRSDLTLFLGAPIRHVRIAQRLEVKWSILQKFSYTFEKQVRSDLTLFWGAQIKHARTAQRLEVEWFIL